MRIEPLILTTHCFFALLLFGAHPSTSAPLHAQAETREEPPAGPAVISQETEQEADVASFEGRDSGDRISILGGNRSVAEGESVRDVLVIGGSLQVHGTVRGDAVVVGGNLALHPTGRIRGDVVVAGGRFRNLGGTVEGEMRTMDHEAATAAAAGSEGARERVQHQNRSTFRRIGSGLVGIASTAALVLVLGAMGAAAIFYGNRYVETVADTLRASTARSGAVGLAAAFLVVPAFVVLVVALAVSVVGIPLLILAVPLYPLAVVAASLFGLIAAAYALGERTAQQRRPYRPRHHNAYAYLVTGLVLFFGPVMAGHLVGMTPFLGWVGALIKFVTYGVIWIATLAGLGAVILSRAGTRRTFARAAGDVDDGSLLDDDPFLDKDDA